MSFLSNISGSEFTPEELLLLMEIFDLGTPGQVLTIDSLGTGFIYTNPGSGGSLTIGSAVGGSTNYANLYVDDSGNLANGFILPDSTGVTSVNLNARSAYDNTGAISYDYNLRKLYEHFGAVNIDYSFANGAYLAGILDATGGLIIDPSGFKAYNSSGQISLNWNDSLLNDATGVLSANYNNRTLYDSTGMINSINWSGRNLLDPNGTTAVDWTLARTLNDSSGSPIIDYSGTVSATIPISFSSGEVRFHGTVGEGNGTWQILGDGSAGFAGGNFQISALGVVQDNVNLASIAVPNRILYASDGTTSVIDWSDTYNGSAGISFISLNPVISGYFADTSGAPSLSTSNRLLYTAISTVVMDWTTGTTNIGSAAYWFDSANGNRITGDGSGLTGITAVNANYLYDTAGTPKLSADGINRVLYEADGTTPMIDWSGTYPDISTGISIGNSGIRFNDQIIDGTGAIAAKMSDRLLYATDGTTPQIDWTGTYNSAAALSFSGFSPVFPNGGIADSGASHFQSIDTNGRVLYASDGNTPLIDWSNVGSSANYYFASGILTGDGSGLSNVTATNATNAVNANYLYDATGSPLLSVDGNNRELITDDGSGIALKWNLRQAIASDNTTQAIDWSGSGTAAKINIVTAGVYFASDIVDNTGMGSIDPTSRNLLDGGQVASEDWNLRILYDSTGTAKSQNWDTRLLYAADGTTALFDWSNVGATANYYFSVGILQGDGSGLTNVQAASLSDTNIFSWDGQRWGPSSNARVGSTDGLTYLDNSGFHGDGSSLTALDPANITGYTTSINDVLHGDSSWAPVDLAAGVTGVLPVANGGTGQATLLVIAGSFSGTGTVTTTFTVTIGTTQPGTTYKVVTEGLNALSSAVHYVTNKTTTTFDVVYLTGLTGAVLFDWILTS